MVSVDHKIIVFSGYIYWLSCPTASPYRGCRRSHPIRINPTHSFILLNMHVKVTCECVWERTGRLTQILVQCPCLRSLQRYQRVGYYQLYLWPWCFHVSLRPRGEVKLRGNIISMNKRRVSPFCFWGLHVLAFLKGLSYHLWVHVLVSLHLLCRWMRSVSHRCV